MRCNIFKAQGSAFTAYNTMTTEMFGKKLGSKNTARHCVADKLLGKMDQ